MKKQICVGLIALCGTIISNSVFAQTEDLNVTTTAVPFLRISPDARAGGMGDAGIATSPDVNAPFWNLAKIAFAKNSGGIGLNYCPWLRDLGLNDVYLATLSGFTKLGDGQSAIGGSLRYFSLGNIQFTDALGQNITQGRPREFGLDFGYARKLSDRLSLGIALRYINSNLISGDIGGTSYKAGTAIAGDISLYYDGVTKGNGGGFGWGISLSNLGSKIGYTSDALNKDYIPANLGFGFRYNWAFDESNSLTLATDINKLLVPAPPIATGVAADDSAKLAEYRSSSVMSSWFKSFSGEDLIKSLQFSIGAEYSYNDQFFVRAGYFYEDKTKGNRKYFSAGLGLKYNVIGLNFSYLVPSGNGVTRNPLSNTMRIGISFNLDKDGGGGSTSE